MDNQRERVAAFLQLASEELGVATGLVEEAPRQCAYLMQQAAEKMARAILTGAEVHFGPGHNLGQMAGALPEDHPWTEKIRSLNKHSPAATRGLVEGIAAGDHIRLTDAELGEFSLLKRGGNIAVKLAWPRGSCMGSRLETLREALEEIGARLDGFIDTAAVWTIPSSAGFAAIEKAFDTASSSVPGAEWWYGNVYDDEGKPFGWWE